MAFPNMDERTAYMTLGRIKPGDKVITPKRLEALWIAMNALAARTGLELIREYDEQVDTTFYKCPSCGKHLGADLIAIPNYCPDCGQRLEAQK